MLRTKNNWRLHHDCHEPGTMYLANSIMAIFVARCDNSVIIPAQIFARALSFLAFVITLKSTLLCKVIQSAEDFALNSFYSAALFLFLFNESQHNPVMRIYSSRNVNYLFKSYNFRGLRRECTRRLPQNRGWRSR